MSRISISYVVPVQVHVDLGTGEVERVSVFGELIEPVRNGKLSYFENLDNGVTPTSKQIDKAYTLAEDAMWPAWDFE